MISLNFMKNKSAFNIIILFIFLTTAFVYIYLYHLNSQKELNKSVVEHSQLLAEPLWSFDIDKILNYISILSARKEYLQVQIFDQKSVLIHETDYKEIKGLDKLLFTIQLLPINTISADIIKNKEYLGKITITQKDTDIYYFTYVTLVALLLYVISLLFYSTSTANKKLTSNVSELRAALSKLQKQKDYIESVYHVVPSGLITVDANQTPIDWNSSYDLIITTWASVLNKEKKEVHNYFFKRLLKEIGINRKGEFFLEIDGQNISFSYESSDVSGFDYVKMVISLYDRTDADNMRRRLLHTDKLESIGRLAAGIAHEINTPTQYVLSNIDFLAGAFEDVHELIEKLEALIQKISFDQSQNVDAFESILEGADWDYLSIEIPDSIKQSGEGLQRIQSIVSAMKTFSHPSGDSPEICDLNMAIQSTVTVASNEWKYLAELELDLAEDLPHVPCFIDHFNQVILIMIINGVHAIEEQLAISGEAKGTITISTKPTKTHAEISISDNGVGMTKEVQNKALDPFFTTKAVNKGTGQGLTIANDIITSKHSGSLEIRSEPGEGTTFIISLPYQTGDKEVGPTT